MVQFNVTLSEQLNFSLSDETEKRNIFTQLDSYYVTCHVTCVCKCQDTNGKPRRNKHLGYPGTHGTTVTRVQNFYLSQLYPLSLLVVLTYRRTDRAENITD